MRRIFLLLIGAAILALPAAAAARAQGLHSAPVFLVVRNAVTDGGVTGSPVATVVVQGGFVLGHVAQEGAVQIYHLKSSSGSLTAQAAGIDVFRRAVTYHSHGVAVPGAEFSGSDFRFRAVGGVWRVVVKGAGVSIYAAGEKMKASLHGSVAYPRTDGRYSFNGAPFASMPSGTVTRILGTR
jgi:hypothetical protein